MAKNEASIRIYIVVDVFRGFAEEAKSFCRYKDARAYLRQLRKGRNLEMDDFQIFEDVLKLPVRSRTKRSA